MPRLYNIGSLNIDLVYRTAHIVRPGETIASTTLHRFAGGKGANQSVAAARAGAQVEHVGCVGGDGRWLRDLLGDNGVGVGHVAVEDDAPTGHAVIQVSEEGENAIVLFAGTNHHIDTARIDAALEQARPQDWVLTQNETGNAAEVLRLAGARGLRLAFNPAPMGPGIGELSLEPVSLLVVNQTESAELVGESAPEVMLDRLLGRVRAGALVVVTLGADGAIAGEGDRRWRCAGLRVERVVDTTGAGDTFTGYLTACLMKGLGVDESLRIATAAAARSVTKAGAIPSIPRLSEL